MVLTVALLLVAFITFLGAAVGVRDGTHLSVSLFRDRSPRPVRFAFFVLSHLAVLGAIWTGVTWQAAVLCAVLFVVRIWGVTAGYHRYFAHRAYKTSRAVQFLMALLGTTALQKGVLWWSAHHRNHHTLSDLEGDALRADGEGQGHPAPGVAQGQGEGGSGGGIVVGFVDAAIVDEEGLGRVLGRSVSSQGLGRRADERKV